MSNPVSKTAFYCGGVRMVDARSAKPLLGDRYAERLMEDDGRQIFEAFAGLANPNGSNLVRHRIIDELLRERFKGQPSRLTVLLGAGLDTRPFRLGSGAWVELDEAPIIERKERLLPSATCPQSLTRIPIDFARESIGDKLGPFASPRKTTIVLEGVSMYLTEQIIKENCRALTKLFPNHTVICDLMTASFLGRYGQDIQRVIESLGARFTWTVDKPAALFTGMGYKQTLSISIPLRAAEMKAVKLSPWVVRWLLPSPARRLLRPRLQARGRVAPLGRGSEPLALHRCLRLKPET